MPARFLSRFQPDGFVLKLQAMASDPEASPQG
jgi:hypothetical protein